MTKEPKESKPSKPRSTSQLWARLAKIDSKIADMRAEAENIRARLTEALGPKP